MLNEPLDKAMFVAWMERLIQCVTTLENRIDNLLKRHNVLEGEVLLDNQDLCFLLKVSKRSLLWGTFHLNEKYGEFGLMKIQAIRNHPHFIINRRRIIQLITRIKRKEEICEIL